MPEWIAKEWFLPSTLRSFVWESPLYLYFLFGIPILFLLRWMLQGKSGRKLNLNFGNSDHRKSWERYLRFVIPLFNVTGLAFLLIALARPQRALLSGEELVEGINIILAMDISESMKTEDLKPNRLDAAKEVALEFLKGRKNDKIGLIVFAGEAITISPLTSDYSLLEYYIQRISWHVVSSTGTAIGDALATAINRLRDTPGESKAIILLSDGDNTSGNLSPSSASDLAKSFGIRVYTIAIGKELEQENNVLDKVATNSEGVYYSAGTKASLSSVFQQINQLEKSRFDQFAMKDLRDYYYVYLNWAMVFLLLAFLLKNTFIGNALED